MSQFKWTTLLTLTAALVVLCLLHGPARTWTLITLAAIYVLIFTLGVTCIRFQFFAPAICRAQGQPKSVALTFDDGPDPASTPILLDLLSREKIQAAFFCIGKNVAAHPQLAARIVSEGHLLGNHTYRHLWWTNFMLGKGLLDEMTRTQEAIQQATGVTPRYMRPPVGLTNPHYPGLLKKAGLTLMGWDVRTFDKSFSVRTVLRRIARQTRDGSIILLHDGGVSPEQLLKVVNGTITKLRSRGFAFERVDRLIAQDAGKSTGPMGSSPAR